MLHDADNSFQTPVKIQYLYCNGPFDYPACYNLSDVLVTMSVQASNERDLSVVQVIVQRFTLFSSHA